MDTVDPRQLADLIARTKTLAVEYRRLTGRPLGVTGEVAEYEAARLLGLRLAPARQSGYDAVRSDGTRLQVKARCILSESTIERFRWASWSLVCGYTPAGIGTPGTLISTTRHWWRPRMSS
jgi:hypothetical protein